MNDNLPPLPPCAPEFKPRWPTDPGGYNEDQMKAYARAAIERQSVPDLNRLTPFVSGLGKAILQELIEDMAAAPQPQPVQPEGPMAETVEQAARDVAKCLNERDGQGLDLRHVAMLVHYAQQPVQQEPVAYLDIGAGGYLDIATNLTDEQLWALPKGRHALVIAGTFGIDGYTSPQAQPAQPAQPLSDDQKQEIHNETGAGHALISLVESYITKGTT